MSVVSLDTVRGLGFESPRAYHFLQSIAGLFNSVMVPNIFTLGIAGLGPLTGKGSGILVMSIVGGTIPPVRVGARANRIGVHHAFLLLTVCYLYGVCHGFRGSKPVVAF